MTVTTTLFAFIALPCPTRKDQSMDLSPANEPTPAPTKKRSGFARFLLGPEDAAIAWFDSLQVFSDGRIGASSGDYEGKRSAEGFTIALEDGEELSKRVTFTRFVATGLLSLALKKKRGGEKWLVAEGPNAEWLIEVPRKKQADAMKFMQAFRKAVREAETAG